MAVTISRHHDGRHAVHGPDGSLLGLHNSVASAQRQMQDYYPGQGASVQPLAARAQASDMALQAEKAKQSAGPQVQAPVIGTLQPGGAAPIPPMGNQMQALQGAMQGHPGAINPGQVQAMQGAPHPAVAPMAAAHAFLGGPAQPAAPAGPPSNADLGAGMAYGQAVMQGKAKPPPGFDLLGAQKNLQRQAVNPFLMR